jgi:hypothetical protein
LWPNVTRSATHGGPVGLDRAPWSGAVRTGPTRAPTCGLPDDRACYHLGAHADHSRPALRGGHARCATPRRPGLRHHGPAVSLADSNPALACVGIRGHRGECCGTWVLAERP